MRGLDSTPWHDLVRPSPARAQPAACPPGSHALRAADASRRPLRGAASPGVRERRSDQRRPPAHASSTSQLKSIAACDVSPSQLCFLVGPNGSGKSNFLDALRFVRDALRHSIDHALRERGGINDVRRRSSGHPTHFTIRVELALKESDGHYAFTVGAKRGGGFEVQVEECLVVPSAGGRPHYYKVERGQVRKSSLLTNPVAAPDRLYLVNVSGDDSFRPAYDALSAMGFYSLNPQQIRELQSPDPGELLNRDGSNIASVLANLSRRSPDFKDG